MIRFFASELDGTSISSTVIACRGPELLISSSSTASAFSGTAVQPWTSFVVAITACCALLFKALSMGDGSVTEVITWQSVERYNNVTQS